VARLATIISRSIELGAISEARLTTVVAHLTAIISYPGGKACRSQDMVIKMWI
jgi:hypothetical protein